MNERRRAAAHAFVADLDAPVLDTSDAHHLSRVLRLAAGEVVTVSDGAGRWRPCAFVDGGLLDPTGSIVAEPQPAPAITIGFVVMKGDRPEGVVQKLTEIGVDRIVPLSSARSVVRWDADRAAKNVERWRKVAREAAMQSRRVWLPVVDELTPFAAAVAAEGVCVAEPGGARLSVDRPFVLVGPEGGFTDDELAAAPAQVSLGRDSVLRADTACLVAAAALVAQREDLDEFFRQG